MCARPADKTREIAVRDELPGLQVRDKRPHVFLKFRSFELQRKIEAPQAFAKVRVHLSFGFPQYAVSEPGARCDARRKVCRHYGFTVAVNNQGCL